MTILFCLFWTYIWNIQWRWSFYVQILCFLKQVTAMIMCKKCWTFLCTHLHSCWCFRMHWMVSCVCYLMFFPPTCQWGRSLIDVSIIIIIKASFSSIFTCKWTCATFLQIKDYWEMSQCHYLYFRHLFPEKKHKYFICFRYLYNTFFIYTFSWTMPPLESLSHSQVHVCIITVLSLCGL